MNINAYDDTPFGWELVWLDMIIQKLKDTAARRSYFNTQGRLTKTSEYWDLREIAKLKRSALLSLTDCYAYLYRVLPR